MKKDIQPKLYDVNVILTNGTSIVVKSSRDLKTITLEADFINHPAWKKESTGNLVNLKNDRVDRFNKKHKDAF